MAAHKSSLITMLIFKSFFPLFKQQNFWVCPSHSVFARLAFCMPSANIMMCLQTWADWKNIPIFYILYDWLLGLLEDALSPFERPHSITITAAWQHTLCVAILGSGIFFVAACRLGWILLVYCYKGKTLECTPSWHLAVLTTTHAQRGSRPEGNTRDVGYGQGLCYMPVAACLHIMHVHGTCHHQPRARQVLAMSALQPLVQAVQSAFLMALSQPETCFWPCVSNHLLRTFRSYISPN